MQNLSIVIVCKNSSGVIGKTLQSFSGLTDDIVVYDNGSTDNTAEIAEQSGACLFRGNWEGFGITKNKAIRLAKYDWILSLDADEAIDEVLKSSLLHVTFDSEKTVYELVFKNFVGDKYLKYGDWGWDRHIRLFSRNAATWNDSVVHERLITPHIVRVEKLKGYVLHSTADNLKKYKEKMIVYASLTAEEYFKKGKNPWWGKQWLSPIFTFIKNYIFRFGFLEGRDGYISACITARYTFLKYVKLKELINNQ